MTAIARPERHMPRLTVLLLVFGWVVFGLGQFVGLAMLWTSARWTRREQWFGTLIPAATWTIPILLWLGGSTQCSGHGCSTGSNAGHVLAIVAIVIPVALVAWCARRLLAPSD